MGKEIKLIEEINFLMTYQIEVVLPEQFMGSFVDHRVFTECTPEVKVDNGVDFSFDLDDENDGYEDIPDESIVVIKQSDIDDGIIIVRELGFKKGFYGIS
jgi:hypothetical protein